MPFKFEKLEVWRLSLDYADRVDELVKQLPKEERFNLTDQMRRAATSVSLNIAEGSTGQTDAEQGRFLGMALRSLIETVACLHLIRRRGYVEKSETAPLYWQAETLAAKLQAMRKTLQPEKPWVREGGLPYVTGEGLDDEVLDDGRQTMDDVES